MSCVFVTLVVCVVAVPPSRRHDATLVSHLRLLASACPPHESILHANLVAHVCSSQWVQKCVVCWLFRKEEVVALPMQVRHVRPTTEGVQ